MDIQELIERLKIHLQSYAAYNNPDLARTLEDAIYALSTLQGENKKLRDELEQAIQTMHGDCDYCVSRDKCCLDEPCKGCKSFAAKELVTGDYWQWRGIKED